jgi:HSP20 family protein
MTDSNKIWCPALELNETDTELILKAELPGVELKELQVHAEVETISIAGVHQKEQQPKAREIIPSQLHYGPLQCHVPLPVPINVEQVRAELVDGVLTITMPKLEQASSTKAMASTANK